MIVRSVAQAMAPATAPPPEADRKTSVRRAFAMLSGLGARVRGPRDLVEDGGLPGLEGDLCPDNKSRSSEPARAAWRHYAPSNERSGRGRRSPRSWRMRSRTTGAA